jgi:hypothetical protein
MTDMKLNLQAVLTAWLGVVMLVLAGTGTANAQNVLQQVLPGQAQQQEEQQPCRRQ